MVRVINERYLSISDGNLRKAEKPKKKNIRHLHITTQRADDILDSLRQGEIPANHVIKKTIKQIIDKGLIHGEGGLVSG